jgi:hypothetical protein
MRNFLLLATNGRCGLSKVSSSLGNDGSDDMLALIVSSPAAYKTWAEEYYEVAVSLAAVEALFSHQPLDDALILALNPDADLSAVYAEADGNWLPAPSSDVSVSLPTKEKALRQTADAGLF